MIADKKKELHDQLYDIYGLWHTPWWQTGWFKVVAILGVSFITLLSVVLIYFWWKKRKRKRLAADQHALKKLHRLLEKPTFAPAEGKYMYATLTDILKQYLAQQFAYDTGSKTDQELIIFLKKESIAPAALIDIEEIVAGAQCVKFAQQQALYKQFQHHVARAITFIEQTKPKPQH